MIGGEALGSIFDFCIAMEGRLGTWSMQLHGVGYPIG